MSNVKGFSSQGNARPMSKDQDLSNDVLSTQHSNVPRHGTPSALQVNEGLLTLLKQTYTCTLGSRLEKKHPCMTHKAIQEPATQTLQTPCPGPLGRHRHLTMATHCLVDTHTPAGWPWVSYFISLSLSDLLCKMGLTTRPTTQGCCEGPMRQHTEGLSPSLALAKPCISSCCWRYLNCTDSQYCPSL